MDNRAGEMSVFVRVVDAGSFSQAARQMLMTPSTVSKLIVRLELRLGVRLLERSTRKLSLTDEGRIYYERSHVLLTELDDVERELAQGAQKARGTVRINASVAFGTMAIEPNLPAFWQAHPNIQINLSLCDDIVDMYLDRTDIAFRVGALNDSTLRARKIGIARRKIVASPAYLEKHGVPQTQEDLCEHNCLSFNFRRVSPVWPMHQSGRIVDRIVQGNLQANNGETVRRMAIAGVGIARLADFHIDEDLATGRLVEVLAQSGHDCEEVHALYQGGQHVPQRIRTFLDFMVPRLQAFMDRG